MYRPTHISNTTPTINADFANGFRIGNFWYDTSGEIMYLCTGDSTGAAVWTPVTTSDEVGAWADWTPTIAYSPATPGAPTYVARYMRVGDKVNFYFDIQGTNDSGSTITQISLTPPVTIADKNAYPAFAAGSNNASNSSPPTRITLGLIDAESASNRKLYVLTLSIPNTNDYRVTGEGFYEV